MTAFCALLRAWPLLLPLAGAAWSAPMPTTCAAASGAQTAVLVELYTSEGCSDCPPADRWLASRFRAGDPSPPAVALAFHVGYWDRLGWKDRFAAAQFTERQYEAQRANRARFVYTPQVLIQGHDFPDGQRGGKAASAIAAENARPARASIALSAQPRDDAVEVRAQVRIADPAYRRQARLFIAFADSGLVSEVSAGENRGARLVHNHVVRALVAGAPPDAAGAIAFDAILPRPREAGSAPTVVAFVQEAERGDVLQALALPLAEAACTIGR